MYWANNTSVSKNLLQKVIEIEEKTQKCIDMKKIKQKYYFKKNFTPTAL